ncbi:hypothetical protein F4813DRAFT_392822 [Daldinia decipiens]|uniref:uncharacterized protein n=1 Tax=Daldinia decipiens TaxID=326647 RepID=UPI0020C53665|nr:uncharacterized protein F4813DRAFT_392822 [Daldinia decipiens]KAI1654316.1 hypothetical protein F4813DRAFT_392822 [Daldinia decipiens]
MSVQDLARSLVSAGSIKLPGDEGGGIYILSVRDGDLVEKYWVGDAVENENIIASGVRNDTSASYLPSFEQMPRLVIFIDQDNSVRCYAYDEDMEEWEETPLGNKWNITTSSKSKLSAIIGPEGEMVVSYQDETDRLSVIISTGEDGWTSFGPLDGDPIVGTPQCLEIINDKLHLFYVNKGSGIGYLVFNSSTGSWKANVLENTKFSTAIDNFSVAEDLETGSLQSYFLTDGSLWSVSGDKEKTFLGERQNSLDLAIYVAMGNDKQQDFIDFDLENYQVPIQYWHSTQRRDETYVTERFGIDLSTPARRWENWVVKLTFEKLGSEKHGSGFYVNVPNASYDIILTAGHNLVDKPEHYCSNIKIVQDPFEKKDIDVQPEMIRVCRRYFEDPDELNEIYDYGAILLKRSPSKRHRGFGFHLMLGLAPQLGEGAAYTEDEGKDILRDHMVYVCGYAPEDLPPDKSPRRSEGRCIGTLLHQLRYDANTKPGMSGGPVWVGFRGVETIVAIHNVWRDIFKWLNVGWHGKSLHCCNPSTYSMHLHLPQKNITTPNEGRVRVGKPGKVETLFDVVPVAARPTVKDSNAGYGFLLRPVGLNVKDTWPASVTSPWVRWDPKKNKVSRSNRFNAQCEVKLPGLIIKPEKPFEIQTQEGDGWKQVQMEMRFLDEGDLELLEEDPQSFEDTSEISFGSITKNKNKNKLFQFK